MVTGETLLRLAAFAFLCTLVVTHRPAPQVVVVERGDVEEAPSDLVSDGDRDLEEPGSPAPVRSCVPTVARVNRALVRSIERDPWQLLNPSLVAAFGLGPDDVVTKIEKVGQPGEPKTCQNGQADKLLSMTVMRGGIEYRHDIFITD